MSATADEVLEAMARGICDCDRLDAGWPPVSDEEWPEVEGYAYYMRRARAAIRALPPGWVVAKVPGSMPFYHDDTDDRVFEKRGYNAALAAVRASAVEVE